MTFTGDRQIELRLVATSRCHTVADESSGGPDVEVHQAAFRPIAIELSAR